MRILQSFRKKKFNRIDSLLEILEYLYQNHESQECGEKALKQKFGQDRYKDLSLYAIGGSNPFAHQSGSDTDPTGQIVRLTQRGVREFFKLKSARESEMHNVLQNKTNIALYSVTVILALGVLWDIMKDVRYHPELRMNGFILIGIIAFMFMVPNFMLWLQKS